MVRVGLTGGIGSGKSTVARRLRELGAVVVDSDALAREVVQPGSLGLAQVVEAFGPAVLAPDRTLDRAALAQVAFADEASRRQLEQITHPLIAARAAQIMDQAADDAVVVHDVPLLVEKHMAASYDLVVVVEAALEVRLTRLRGRGLDEHEARSRISAQASDEQRRAVADVILDNSGTREQLLEQVETLWTRLVER